MSMRLRAIELMRAGALAMTAASASASAAALPMLLARLKADGYRVVHLKWQERETAE